MFGEAQISVGENGISPEVVESNHAERGKSDLKSILTDPDYENKFISVQTIHEQTVLDDLISTAVKDTLEADKKTWFDRADQLALEALTQTHNVGSLDEARRLGKIFGKARGEAMNQVKTEFRGNVLEHPTPQVQEALEMLQQAQKEKRDELERVRKEFQERQDDPALFAALDTWGQSRNSQNEAGQDGRGYNAGVVHYFEYRADKGKNGRYKFEKSKFGIQSFIDYSMRLKSLIDNPNPENNDEIAQATLIGDEQEQRRLYLLTKHRRLVLAFKSTKDDRLRVITDFPGQNETSFQNRITKELTNDPQENRFNKLGDQRRVLPLAGSTEPQDRQRESSSPR